MKENTLYAKRKGREWWSVIDCGVSKEGGFTVGNFWTTHFKHLGRTYRWSNKLFNPPADLTEWQEIKTISQYITFVTDSDSNVYEGFDDGDNLAYYPLIRFAELLGHKLNIEDVKNLIDKN